MAFSLAQKFVSLGMAPALAKEYASQLESGIYNWRRLMWLGMVPSLSKYVSESLAAENFDQRTAVEKTMSPAVAALTTGVGASSFAPYPAPSGFRWDFVTEDGARVTQDNEPVVDLVRAA